MCRCFRRLARTLSELPAGHDLAKRKPGDFHEASRNPASLAVARNGGMGSQCLNADVKALDRLQSVRGWDSSCCGEKYRSCEPAWPSAEHFEFHFEECAVNEQFCRYVGELVLPPSLDLRHAAVTSTR